jgi:hypothetical protein
MGLSSAVETRKWVLLIVLVLRCIQVHAKSCHHLMQWEGIPSAVKPLSLEFKVLVTVRPHSSTVSIITCAQQ